MPLFSKQAKPSHFNNPLSNDIHTPHSLSYLDIAWSRQALKESTTITPHKHAQPGSYLLDVYRGPSSHPTSLILITIHVHKDTLQTHSHTSTKITALQVQHTSNCGVCLRPENLSPALQLSGLSLTRPLVLSALFTRMN